MPGLFLNGGVPLGTLGLAVRKGEELRRACHWGSGGTEAPFIKGSPYKCLERLRIGEQKKRGVTINGYTLKICPKMTIQPKLVYQLVQEVTTY